MNSMYRLLLIPLVATALAVPGDSAAQTVCKGFSTVLKAMKRYRDRKKLEFYTLPGATCELSGDTYSCVWSRPRPHKSAGGAAFREWHGKVSSEMKKLAGAFQQCIDRKQVPYVWDSFERRKISNYLTKYYIFTERRPKMSVVLCIRIANFLLPESQWHTSAAISLSVHMGHKDHCSIP